MLGIAFLFIAPTIALTQNTATQLRNNDSSKVTISHVSANSKQISKTRGNGNTHITAKGGLPTTNALTITAGVTKAQLVAGFIGNGILVNNYSLNSLCNPNQYGTFTNSGATATALGINSGVILSTGYATDAGTANSALRSTDWGNTTGYSTNLTNYVEPLATNDPVVLTLTITPSCNTLTIEFVFGSEEYPYYVNEVVNDAFGFFVTGPKPGGGNYTPATTNLAQIPVTTTGSKVVTINNVNNGKVFSYGTCYAPGPCTNCAYFNDNSQNCNGVGITYNGYTDLISSSLSVIPCQTYTFEIALADAADGKYDSGVFLKQLYCSSAVQAVPSSTGACTASSNGTATANASSGQTPYTYSWSPGGQTTSTATGLSAGTYSVTIADATGCIMNSNTYTVAISTLPSGTVTATSTSSVTCNGASNGTASVSISGGSAPYTYSWSPGGQTTTSATGLSATNYSVTVTSSNGCASTKTVSISQPTALSNSISATASVTCHGSSTGSVTITSSGGTPPYTYSWNSGQSTSAVTGLSTGNYTVTVKDKNGCPQITTVNIAEPAAALSNTVASTASVTCYGNSTGSVTVTTSGGTPNYTYSWNSSPVQTTATATGLPFGNYTVSILDKNSCPQTATVSIAQPVAALSNTVASTASVTCYGNSTGSVTVTSSGGTPNYTYSWNSSPVQTTATATGLPFGNYTVSILDKNSCPQTATVSIAQPATAITNSITASTQATCAKSNGTATTSASGGTPGYSYTWATGQTTLSATGFSAGTYTVIAADANGCTASSTVTISAANGPTVTATTSNNVSCNGGNDGNATTSISGGTPQYTYAWTNGQTTSMATGLSSGNYTITVTDANNCSYITSSFISEPPLLTNVISSITNVSCNGGSDGIAIANTSGGTPNYTYSWTNGQTTSTATGLGSGNYTVTITDNLGCIQTTTVGITQPTVLANVVSSVINVSCNGGNDGSAIANTSGGTPQYTYAWTNGQTTSNATGLGLGNYTVTITDSLGCLKTSAVNITQPTLLTNSISSTTNVSCNGGSNGIATVNPAGGTPAYTYSWTNGQTTSTATGLILGNYSVTVTDNKGCAQTATVTITEPTILTNTISSSSNVSCNGFADGSATAIPSGGTPNYTYSWTTTPAQNTQTATGLSLGVYTVTVKDNKGCLQTATVSISQPTVLTNAISSSNNVSCFGVNDGTASATINGGVSPYTYSWSSGQTTATASGLLFGNYSITVTDNNGCVQTATVSISQPQLLTASTSSVICTCNGGSDGSATVNPSGGTPNYTYAWNNGQTTQVATGLAVGNYSVAIVDANGCTKQTTVAVSQPGPISLSVSGNDSICIGSNAVLSANVNGGTPIFTYFWNPGNLNGSSIVVSPTSASNYSVSIIDGNGCSSLNQVFHVSLLPVPTALFDTASTGTYGSTYSFVDLSTPSVTITAWHWFFGDGDTSTQQNPVHAFPGSGTYTVTEVAFNNNGCPDTFKIVVNVNEGIIIPNVFTPDGDGINDVWYIPNSGMKEFHVEIFDRWGLKVFETTADEIRWDGHSGAGNLLTDGTYYYVLRAILKSGKGVKDYSTAGYVTLLTNKK